MPEHARVDEVIALRGHVRVKSYDARTHQLVDVVEAENVVCTAGKTAFLHLLGGDGVVPIGLQYLAVGTGVGTPAASDVQLFSELARLSTTQVALSANTVTVYAFFTSVQANGTWTEVGAFGNNASSAANSGTLFGHAALAYAKNNTLETVVAYSFSAV